MPPPLPFHHHIYERASSPLSSWQDGYSLLLMEKTLKVFVGKQWLFVLGDSIVISKVHLGLGMYRSGTEPGQGSSCHLGIGQEGRDPWPLVTCVYMPITIN